MDRVRFVTLFPNCPNVCLFKDVGQIPYMMGRQYSEISGVLASYAIDPLGPGLEQTKGLEIDRCPNVCGNVLLSGLLYILRNAGRIDWLNVYHARLRTCIWIWVYKRLNPKGKVYLKLDAGFVSCQQYGSNIKKRKVFAKATELADLVTVESLAVLERLSQYSKRQLRYITNGYCETEHPAGIMGPRQNTFITVGRLGSPEKATDLLLEAFARTASQHDWTLKLVGPVAPEFEPEKQRFLETHPELAERVIFAGAENDRDVLNAHYSSAKVFVLPSRWESFALVVPEALACGCKLIVSDQVAPCQEFTAGGRFGQVVAVDNVDAWAQALLDATREEYTPELAKCIAAYAEEKYTWKNICEQLRRYMG